MIKLGRERVIALSELMVAAAFWGFGFIAAVWALKVLSAYQVTFLRFFLAFLFGVAVITARRQWPQARGYLKISIWPALFLVGTLIFQTVGLHYTSVAKSGFITTLYVVFVPLLESVMQKRNLPWALWFYVVLALAGTFLLVGGGFDDLNFGDLLTLICAFFATLQIYVLGRVSPQIKQPFTFNTVQTGWAALICLPFVLFTPVAPQFYAPLSWPDTVWAGLLLLSFGSTILAFYLQIRAQAKLSATVSSLLFLLESPFALIFAMLLLGEHLSLSEAIGAVLIFVAAVGASLVAK